MPFDHVSIAMQYCDGGLYEKAERSCNDALAADPDNHEAKVLRGYARFNLGQLVLAEQDWLDCIASNGFAPLAAYHLGNLCFSKDRFDEALAYFTKSAELGNIDAHLGLGRTLFTNGMTDNAIDHCTQAILSSANPTIIALAYQLRSSCHNENGDFDAADSDYDEAERRFAAISNS